MSNGNIDVGNKALIGKPVGPMVEYLAGQDSSSEPRKASPKTARGTICGAMSQQREDGGRGIESAPQKFVQLVGCRDSKARPEVWVRPHSVPVKR